MHFLFHFYVILTIGNTFSAHARSFAGRVIGEDGNLRIALTFARKFKRDPCSVVREIFLDKNAIGIRGADEVVDARRYAGNVELLAVSRLMILINPAGGDSLIISTAVKVCPFSCRRVVIELVPINEAERDFL